MSILNFFSKNKKQPEITKDKIAAKESMNFIPDYKNAIELAKIITNNDEVVVKDITLLVENYSEFYEKHKDWCDELSFDDDIFLNFAYWLVGYDTDFKYGAYIDWKEAPEEIISNLEPAIMKLGYPLVLSKIDFSENGFTPDALRIINEYFVTQDYRLVHLDTQSDCYHLFIVKANDFDKIVALGKDMNFNFIGL